MSSTKKKNKNKNKITPDPPASAPASATSTTTSTNKSNNATATNQKSNQIASKSAAPKSSASSTPSSSTTPTPARPSLLVGASADDDAPLVRGTTQTRKSPATSSSLTTTTESGDERVIKDDVLFGKQKVTAEEKLAKKRKAVASNSAKKKAKNGATASGEDGEEEPIDLFTGTTTAQTLKHLSEPLSHSSLKPGMLVLGAVRAVNEVDLTVQLPHGLTGYVSMREISDTIATIVDQYIEQGERAESEEKSEDEPAAITLPILTDFIRVGQLVQCYILSVGELAKEASAQVKHSGETVAANKSRRIEISLRASLFNQNLSLASLTEGRTLYGSVKSIQEKGYVIDVGVSATTPVQGQPITTITAFLPFTKAPADLLLPPPKRVGREKKKIVVKKEGEDNSTPVRRLCVGMPIQTVITTAKNKNIIGLTAEPSIVNAAVMHNSASETTGMSDMDDATALKNTIGFTNLQPGMLVKATVVSVIGSEEQRKNNTRMSGLYVRFLDFFHGIIDNLHSSSDASIEGSLESMFHETQRVTARILYVNYITKKIALSLLPHIVAFEPYTFPRAVKCGDKIMDSIITKVESKQGIYLRLPVPMEGASKHQIKQEKKTKTEKKKSEKKEKSSDDESDDADEAEDEREEASDDEKEAEDGDEEMKEDGDDDEEKVDVSDEQSLSAWAHISRITDSHITQVPKNMTVGTTAPCRILNFHYLDAMVHVSTQPHILEQSILYYEDVQPAMEVSGEIVSVEAFGVLLKLTPHITALIPTLHLSDIVLSDPSKKFKVGQTLKARVLYVEERQKKIICTLKKNLINSSLPKLLDYNTLLPGMVAHGFIASVKDYGLIIEFYNKVHGLVSTQDLIRTSFLKQGQVPSAVFKRGDVHKARIVFCDQRKQRLQLSLGLVAPKKADAVEVDTSIDLIAAPGAIVAGSVKEVQKDGLLLILDEEEEKPKAKKGKKAAEATPAKREHTIFLPSAHLTDDEPSVGEALLGTYQVGHKFDRVIVLHKDKALKIPVVSAKPSFLASVEPEAEFTLPSTYDTIQTDSVFLGYIRGITDFGLFIGGLDHVTVLAPRRLLGKQFMEGDLADHFQIGATVRAKVATVEAQEGENAHPKISVKLIKKKRTDEEKEAHKSSSVIKVGSIIPNLVVKRILPGSGLLVAFGSSADHQKLARIHITDLSDDWTKDPLSQFSEGQLIPKAIVIDMKEEPAVEKETTQDDDEEDEEGKEESTTSKSSTRAHHQIDLSLRPSRLARSKSATPKFPDLTSFDDLVGKEGTILQGYVRSTSKAGCFIALSHNLVGRCMIKNLSDGYVTDVDKHFPAGKFLPYVRVMTVDPEARTIEVTLRKNDGSKSKASGPNGESLYKYEELNVGDTVKGVITQIKPYGLFIRLKDSSVSGLCHISEVSDTFIDDLSKHYEVGDKVKARVVKKDDAKKTISLGLKAKYFTETQPEDEEEGGDEAMVDDEDEEGESDVDMEDVDENEEESKTSPKKRKAASSDEDEEEEVEMDDARACKKARTSEAATTSSEPLAALPSTLMDDGEMADAPSLNLDLNSSFSLLTGGSRQQAPVSDDEESDLEDEDGDDADGDAVSKKKSRRAKAGAKKAEERALASKEHAILDPTAQPESAEEFERIIVQNPNASMVWIKFMAYQISLTEIDKARKVAERALKQISFRSPQEKLNVWIALLNLENMYGTQKTMQEVFNRAVQFNDPQTVYMEVAKIYAATKKVDAAIETYEGALKKFHGAPSIWSAYAQFLYTIPARVGEARELLKRALQRLDKSEHIALICKFASLEFHVANNVDRGRTLMEGVLSNYPKRVDLWNIYLDMEVKLGNKLAELQSGSSSTTRSDKSLNHESIRRLFDRIIALNLSTKKMKFFFKKYLAWEKTSGGADPERLEKVKTKAREYVASKSQANE